MTHDPLRDTAPLAERTAATHRQREIARNIRDTLANLRTRGWPGKWPRELMITFKGRD